VQKFSSHTSRELPRVIILARFAASRQCGRGQGSQQKHRWRNSVWHSISISLTINIKEGSHNEYHVHFST
jgi:hypothetical protein